MGIFATALSFSNVKHFVVTGIEVSVNVVTGVSFHAKLPVRSDVLTGISKIELGSRQLGAELAILYIVCTGLQAAIAGIN
jgi:hypothetical protein